MAYVLWDRFLRHNPADPRWFNRDRFVLSAGHASAMLYALLHLYGYGLPMEELQRFRQWESRTPGHPEYGLTPGVEATTGPLGQGFGMGAGMAIAERHLAGCFNRDDLELVDHYTYAIVSDGDLMEGVSSEAASLSGTMRLGKLIYLYDDNHISIEGDTENVFGENIRLRFEAYGWNTLAVADGNDLAAIENAIRAAQADPRPTLIDVRTHIGYGSPKQDSGAAHGEPLGPEETKATKRTLGWPEDAKFYIPEEARRHFAQAAERGRKLQMQWESVLEQYRSKYPDLAAQFEQQIRGELPKDWDADLPAFPPEKPMATRVASGKAMNALAKRVPALIGGAGDLSPSTKTILTGYGDFGPNNPCGRNLHFGVREHAMGTMVNGMALHGGVIPYGATFLIFSDYMRPALRLSALMETHSIFVFTHDSIGLGEDGPTHQPIEHLMSLRAMPHMTLIRPADANETVEAWRIAVTRHGPVAMALTRQDVPVLDPGKYPIRNGVRRGAYVLAEAEGLAPDVILIATGSEVQLALAARDKLASQHIRARVVSMPSWELFDEQPQDYRAEVLPRAVPRLAIEAGATLGWCKYVGDSGGIIGVDRFGASAPGKVALEKLGFNVDNVVTHVISILSSHHGTAVPMRK